MVALSSRVGALLSLICVSLKALLIVYRAKHEVKEGKPRSLGKKIRPPSTVHQEVND